MRSLKPYKHLYRLRIHVGSSYWDWTAETEMGIKSIFDVVRVTGIKINKNSGYDLHLPASFTLIELRQPTHPLTPAKP